MYKGLCNIYRAEDLKERKNCEHHTECCKSCQAFDFSVGFQLLVLTTLTFKESLTTSEP